MFIFTIERTMSVLYVIVGRHGPVVASRACSSRLLVDAALHAWPDPRA
jgi:hypothetical protein